MLNRNTGRRPSRSRARAPSNSIPLKARVEALSTHVLQFIAHICLKKGLVVALRASMDSEPEVFATSPRAARRRDHPGAGGDRERTHPLRT